MPANKKIHPAEWNDSS